MFLQCVSALIGCLLLATADNVLAQTPYGTFGTSVPPGGGAALTGTLGTNQVTDNVTKPTSGCYGYGFQYGDSKNGFAALTAGTCPNGTGTFAAANMWTYVSGSGTNTVTFNMGSVNTPTSCMLTPIPTPTLTLTITSPASGPGSKWFVNTGSKYVYVPTNVNNVSFTIDEKSNTGTFVNAYVFNNCAPGAFQFCSSIIWGWFTLTSSTTSPSFNGSSPADNSNQTTSGATYQWTGSLGNASWYEYNFNGGGWTISSGGGTGTSQAVTLSLGGNTFCIRYYDNCNNAYYPNSSGVCRTVYYTPIDACSGTSINWGGNNWTQVGGQVSGTHYNIGNFTQSGTTTIQQGCVFSVSATNITVSGTIDANGKGYAGGSGGSGGGCWADDGNTDCRGITWCWDKDYCHDIRAYGGNAGIAGIGPGGGAIGGGGATSYGTKQECYSVGDEGGRLCGAGGGAGGRGGCYGNSGGGGSGSGGNGTDPGTCTQAGCYFFCNAAGGSASGSACTGYGTSNGYNTIEMGSGGGGGGGGGRGYSAPSSGGNGGNGGGAVKLVAISTINVTGAINANGTNGGAGGNGGGAGDCGRCCTDGSSGCDEKTYVGTGGGGGGAGGGSGGGIYLESTCGTVIISGSLSAQGGSGGSGGSGGTAGASGGGGSGGRIKIFYPLNSGCNTIPAQGTSVNAGGNGLTGTFYTEANATYTFTPGTVASNQTICNGSTPAGLTSTVDASVSGGCGISPVYLWYNCTGGSCAVPSPSSSGTPGGSWASIGGATSNTYSPPALAVTTYYVRRVLLGGCYYWSNRITITVDAVPTASAGSDISTCTGTGAITMTGATAGGTYSGNTWSGGGGLGNWAQNANPALATFTPTVSAGSFTATLTVTGSGGCTGTNPASTRKITWGSAGDWLGVVSSDWFTAANWCSIVPLTTTDVNIPSGMPNMPNINAAGAVCKSITIQSGATLTISGTNNLDVYGNWTNDGTFTPNISTVTFKGAANQSLGGSVASNTFTNLTINNTGASLNDIISLGKPVNVTGTLTLTNGIINSTAALLTIASGGTTTAGVGTPTNSFVHGPIKWDGLSGAGPFIFPTGKNSRWARVAVENLSGADAFTAEYFDTPYSNTTSMISPLQVVSAKEYWNVSPTGATQAMVRLYWEDNVWSDIQNCTQNGDLVVAHFSGGNWNDMGSPSVVGTCLGPAPATGWLRSNNIVSFSPFAFGSKMWQTNPLPIHLLSLSATCYDADKDLRNIEIEWTTNFEINNDFFTLERSFDGGNFSDIATIKSKGNNNIEKHYSFSDNDLSGISEIFYKLRQTDIDGKASVSGIVPVYCDGKEKSKIEVFPVPARHIIHVNVSSPENSTGEIIITDVPGKKIIQNKVHFITGYNLFELSIKDLAPGPYFLHVHFPNGKTSTTKIARE